MNCQRTACGRPGAVCEHRLDHRFYCVPCARKINEHNPMDPPLVTIPADKSAAEAERQAAKNAQLRDAYAAPERRSKRPRAERSRNFLVQSDGAMHAAFDLRAEISEEITLAGG